MKYIGAHVSITGGVSNAPVKAHTIGAKAFALFTGSRLSLGLERDFPKRGRQI